jgi:hypothetical protein
MEFSRSWAPFLTFVFGEFGCPCELDEPNDSISKNALYGVFVAAQLKTEV